MILVYIRYLVLLIDWRVTYFLFGKMFLQLEKKLATRLYAAAHRSSLCPFYKVCFVLWNIISFQIRFGFVAFMTYQPVLIIWCQILFIHMY